METPLDNNTATTVTDSQSPIINGTNLVTPYSSDGVNIYIKYTEVDGFIRSSALPLKTYGTVPLTFIQNCLANQTAEVSYHFANASGTKKSSVFQVKGNYTSTAGFHTFTDVPQGTASDPIYLYVINKTGYTIYGNANTLF